MGIKRGSKPPSISMYLHWHYKQTYYLAQKCIMLVQLMTTIAPSHTVQQRSTILPRSDTVLRIQQFHKICHFHPINISAFVIAQDLWSKISARSLQNKNRRKTNHTSTFFVLTSPQPVLFTLFVNSQIFIHYNTAANILFPCQYSYIPPQFPLLYCSFYTAIKHTTSFVF